MFSGLGFRKQEDLPLPMDVLIQLTGGHTDNTTEVLSTFGLVSQSGDIFVTARRFDPFLFNMLRLIVVPW